MNLNDAIQKYIDNRVPFTKLALVVQKGFDHKNIQTNTELLDEEKDEDEQMEYLRTKFGLLKLIRSSFVKGPTLVDTVTLIKCKDDEISYK